MEAIEATRLLHGFYADAHDAAVKKMCRIQRFLMSLKMLGDAVSRNLNHWNRLRRWTTLATLRLEALAKKSAALRRVGFLRLLHTIWMRSVVHMAGMPMTAVFTR